MLVRLSGFFAAVCRRAPKPAPSGSVARETTGPQDTKISAATPTDLARIEEQAAVAERLAKSHGGSELRGALADLQVLQRVVDSKAIAPTQAYELQCLGIAFGRVMAGNSSLVWVTVEDEYGRDPALNVPGTSVLLFPLTMISKRVEQGRDVRLEALYTTTVTEAERRGAEERAGQRARSEP